MKKMINYKSLTFAMKCHVGVRVSTEAYPMPWAENLLPVGAFPRPRTPEPARHSEKNSTTYIQGVGILIVLHHASWLPLLPLTLRPRSEPLSTGVTSMPFSSGRAVNDIKNYVINMLKNSI